MAVAFCVGVNVISYKDPQGRTTTMTEQKQRAFTQSLSKQDSMDSSGTDEKSIDKRIDTKSSEIEIRRDSSGSNDSGCKKHASLNEIQDLYSALQDLVKTNVSATPVAARQQRFLSSTPDDKPESPRVSPKIEKLRRSEPTSATSSSDSVHLSTEGTDDKNSRHKRGLSSGTVDMINNLMRKSPHPNRKFSQEINSTNTDNSEKHGKKSRSSSGSSDKLKKDIIKVMRKGSSSEIKGHKRWKPKIFSRLRSKSIHGAEGEECSSEGDVSNTPPLGKIRRSSETDVKRIDRSPSNKTCPPLRKQKQENKGSENEFSVSDKVKDIDQLVAALHLEYKDDKVVKASPKTAAKSPENELSKLENWFEKAAAQAVMHQASVDDDADSDNDGLRHKRCNSNLLDVAIAEERKNGGRRVAVVKRGNSQGRIKDERKQLRKTRTKNEERFKSLISKAQSTPNLHDNSDLSDSENSCDYQMSPNEYRRNIISLGEPVGRLPKTPLFYSPEAEQLSQNGLSAFNSTKNKPKYRFFESDVFYTAKKSGTGSNKNSPVLRRTKRVESDSMNQKNNENNASHEANKSRPKSMFTSYLDYPSVDKKLDTDSNANVYRPNMVNMSENEDLWDRFHNGSANKKGKAIMA